VDKTYISLSYQEMIGDVKGNYFRIDPVEKTEIYSAIGLRKLPSNEKKFIFYYSFLPDPYSVWLNKNYFSFYFYNKFLYFFCYDFNMIISFFFHYICRYAECLGNYEFSLPKNKIDCASAVEFFL
jgi:sensor histidine kinase YesM